MESCSSTRKNVEGSVVIFSVSLGRMSQKCLWACKGEQGQPRMFFQSIFLVLRRGSCWWVLLRLSGNWENMFRTAHQPGETPTHMPFLCLCQYACSRCAFRTRLPIPCQHSGNFYVKTFAALVAIPWDKDPMFLLNIPVASVCAECWLSWIISRSH